MTMLYRHVSGSGPEVVLVHGWGMHSGVWEDVAEGLVDDYRVTVLDLPGYGYSRAAERGTGDLAALAAAVLAVAPPVAAWVGWSLGGLVAQQIALTAPQRVSRLALVSSMPCFIQRPDWPHGLPVAQLRRFAADLSQDHHAVLKRFIALEVLDSAHAVTQLRQLRAMLFQHGEPALDALAEGLTILETTDLRWRWPEMVCPVLLLLGQRDRLAPVAAGAAMQTLLPAAQLHVFPQAGHAPFFSHLPEFLKYLRGFLDDRRA